MNCPLCSNSDIRRSHSRYRDDVFQGLLGREAYRCRKCRHRFFMHRSASAAVQVPKNTASKSGGSRPIDTRKREYLVRKLIQVAVVIVMFSLFGLFLSRLAVDHPSAPRPEELSQPSE
jgi:transcriptional regulator NrdR family protein